MRRKREEDKTRLGKEGGKRVGEGCGRVQEEKEPEEQEVEKGKM